MPAGTLHRHSGPTALALIAALAACSGHRPPAEERARHTAQAREVVVAAAWPWEQRTNIRYREGLEMAVEEINAGGGIDHRLLRVQRYDDHESLDEGTIIAQRIAADPAVTAVIGHLQSYITVPVAPLYELAGLVLIAPTATDPSLTTQGYRRVFRPTFTDRDTGRQLADFARGRFHRMAIYYIRNTYGRGLANAFEERANEVGISIAARRSYDPGEQVGAYTFDPTLREWKTLELDGIFLAGEVPSAAQFVVEARAHGLTIPIIGGDAMSSPALMTVAGRAAEGMIVTSFFHPDEPRAEVQRFRAAFQKRFGAVPDAGSALAYDAITLLTRAIRHAGSPVPDRVAAALHALPPWSGVTGLFQFDEQGAAIGKRLVKMVVREGRFDYLPEPAPLTAERQP
jgi:branched-chain amino acid transport system substrate-binding protein